MDDTGSQLVGVPVLSIIIDDLAVAVVGGMDHPILVDLAQPHVVTLVQRVEDLHCDIRRAHLPDDRSVSAIANIYGSVLFGSVAHQGFGPLEGVNVVLEDSGYLVLVEIGHPVEEGVEVALWVSVEGLADGVDGDVVAHEFELVLVFLERVYHEVFLVSR